jgi:hypothetical protein
MALQLLDDLAQSIDLGLAGGEHRLERPGIAGTQHAERTGIK